MARKERIGSTYHGDGLFLRITVAYTGWELDLVFGVEKMAGSEKPLPNRHQPQVLSLQVEG